MRNRRSGDSGGTAFERRMTRRVLLQRSVGVAASVPLLSLLAACGDDDDSSDAEPTQANPGNSTAESTTPTGETSQAPDTSSSPTVSVEAPEPAQSTPTGAGAAGESPESTAFPVTVEHKFGSTSIDAMPLRVLSLGYNDHDHILAFGVTPIAARYWYGEETNVVYPWATDAVSGSPPDVLNMVELDFEAIVSYEPDLIVAIYSGITEDDYATLSQIAPTVAQLGEYIDYGMPWEDTTRLVGAALGMPERAEELIAGVDADFAAAREAHPEFEGASVIVAAMDAEGNIGLFAEQDGRTRILTALGMNVPENIVALFDGTSFYAQLSGEKINELDTADVIVWVQVVFVGRDTIEENALYQQLRVYREGRHVFVEGSIDDAMAFNSALSLPYALEALAPHLAAALDGDRETNEDRMI